MNRAIFGVESFGGMIDSGGEPTPTESSGSGERFPPFSLDGEPSKTCESPFTPVNQFQVKKSLSRFAINGERRKEKLCRQTPKSR